MSGLELDPLVCVRTKKHQTGGTMNKIIGLFIALCSLVSFADNRQSGPRDSNLEQIVSQMQQRILRLEDNQRRLEDRVYNLESEADGGGSYPRPPSSSYERACLLVDSVFSKTFLGKGRTQLEAEANVRQECAKGTSSYYCTGQVRCSDGNADPRSRGYFCTVTDSVFSRTFTGTGSSAIEAEAKAKQACQASTSSYYCGGVTARCEAQR